MWMQAVTLTLVLVSEASSLATIVQTLSSRYGLVLGGYGPGYVEVGDVDVVSHQGVCSGVVRSSPGQLSRFLGDVSGLAEYVQEQVVYCRHTNCWSLDIRENSWNRTGSLKFERSDAASVEVGGTIIVIGGKSSEDRGMDAVEIYDPVSRQWQLREDLALQQPRSSFCAVPVDNSSVMVVGGWSEETGPLASVQILDLNTSEWRDGVGLDEPRYGHACLHTRLNGRDGILLAGGPLAGRKVLFFDLEAGEWTSMPDLVYRTDGHKMVLVEGVPAIFSWQNIQLFEGSKWSLADFRLENSRSAFTVTSVPGHLLPDCDAKNK